MTPLGGTPEGSSHKGYGLAAMVNILSSALSGATMVTDPQHTKKPGTMDIGHFLLAMDPGMFRDADDFRADVGVVLRLAARHQARQYGRIPCSWPAIPNAAPPLSGARPAFPWARVFSPRSATSRSLPARSGSWKASGSTVRPRPHQRPIFGAYAFLPRWREKHT